jgi:hypothetical protein
MTTRQRELVRAVLHDGQLQLFFHPVMWSRVLSVEELALAVASAVFAELTPQLNTGSTDVAVFPSPDSIDDDMDERTVLLMEMTGEHSEHTEVEVRSFFIEDEGRRKRLADDVTSLVFQAFEDFEDVDEGPTRSH